MPYQLCTLGRVRAADVAVDMRSTIPRSQQGAAVVKESGRKAACGHTSCDGFRVGFRVYIQGRDRSERALSDGKLKQMVVMRDETLDDYALIKCAKD